MLVVCGAEKTQKEEEEKKRQWSKETSIIGLVHRYISLVLVVSNTVLADERSRDRCRGKKFPFKNRLTRHFGRSLWCARHRH